MLTYLKPLALFFLKKKLHRLGVGASVSEGHQNISRETARLRGKLVNSNHRHEEGSLMTAMPAKDEDEDESRAGAIKKKARPDPFDILHGKKKKKRLETVNGSKSSVALPPSDVIKTQNSSLSGPSKKCEGEKDETKDDKTPPRLITESFESVFPSPPKENVNQDTPSVIPVANSPKPKSGKLSLFLTDLSKIFLIPQGNNHGPVSSSPAFSPRNILEAELFKCPLLNLTGPRLSNDESDVISPKNSPLTSPKKKRKRRKKKHQITESTPIPSAISRSPLI